PTKSAYWPNSRMRFMISRPKCVNIGNVVPVPVIGCHPADDCGMPSGLCGWGFPQAKTGLTDNEGKNYHKIFALKLKVNYIIGNL
ncbi:MAG: hypothetical protein QNJ02_00985, partial [Desulfobacterales bacterium]|nr:hypothetical protein [Desulfobacterales bacterium]